MGRQPSRWNNLPKGMRARPRGRKVFYYLDTGARPRKEIPLGSDYIAAVAKWADLTSKPAPISDTPISFLHAVNGRGDVNGYRKDVLKHKAPRTQTDNEKELAWLMKFFGGDNPAPLSDIEPVHIRQYQRWRVKQAQALAEQRNAKRRSAGQPELPIKENLGHVRANREIALFSHIWNYARESGLTRLTNPCAGVHKYKESGRDTAPDAELVARVLQHADQPLAFAMRLADIIGQRPADVLLCSEDHIQGGVLIVQQGKTKAKLRIVIEGALAGLIEELRDYKRQIARERFAVKKPAVMTTRLLVRDDGKALTAGMLRTRFDAAREAAGVQKSLFQFRDFRAKVATDADEANGIKSAQALLGHTTEAMTADYIRHKVGKKVRPIR